MTNKKPPNPLLGLVDEALAGKHAAYANMPSGIQVYDQR